MKPEIFIKQVENAFANGEWGVQVTLFRHEITLTAEEADILQKGLLFILQTVDSEKKQ